jgi:dTDP-4-amino-4,6-dideoxygalactose transaminase
VPHSRPLLGLAEEEAALRVLRSGRLAPGPESARGGALLAGLSGCSTAVLLSSGTTALTLALRALRIGTGHTVAIPSYACAALLHAVRAAGAAPLVCDIEPDSLALDPLDIARRGPEKVRAAIVVHPFGEPVPLEPYRDLGLLVVEDCAQAIGARDRGSPVGARGDAAVFSFAPTKVLTCGGPGGGLASPREATVDEVRDLAGHDEKDDDRQRTNGLMGDLHAAVAAVQMERLTEFLDRRRALARLYDERLLPLGLERPASFAGTEPIVFRYMVRVPDAGRLIEALAKSGIVARHPVYRPLHRITRVEGTFPNTDRAQRTLVSLPLYPALTDTDTERVITEVRRCLS